MKCRRDQTSNSPEQDKPHGIHAKPQQYNQRRHSYKHRNGVNEGRSTELPSDRSHQCKGPDVNAIEKSSRSFGLSNSRHKTAYCHQQKCGKEDADGGKDGTANIPQDETNKSGCGEHWSRRHLPYSNCVDELRVRQPPPMGDQIGPEEGQQNVPTSEYRSPEFQEDQKQRNQTERYCCCRCRAY